MASERNEMWFTDGDALDRLCHTLYDRPPNPADYLGGSDAQVLTDARAEIERLRAEVNDLQETIENMCIERD